MQVMKMLWTLTILFVFLSTINAAPKKSKRNKDSSSEEHENKKSRSVPEQGDVDIHRIEELIDDLREDLKHESEKWNNEVKDLRGEIEGVLQYTGTKSRIQDVKIRSLKRDIDDIYSIIENQTTDEEEIEQLTTGEDKTTGGKYRTQPTFSRYNAVQDSNEKSTQSDGLESNETDNNSVMNGKSTMNEMHYGVYKKGNAVPNKGT